MINGLEVSAYKDFYRLKILAITEKQVAYFHNDLRTKSLPKAEHKWTFVLARAVKRSSDCFRHALQCLLGETRVRHTLA